MILANEPSPGSSPAAAARRSTACTSGPTRRRSSLLLAKLADLERADAARARRSSRRRRPPSSPARSRERVTELRRAVGPRAGGVSRARPARAQAGALRPAQPRPLRASRAPRTATSPRRSAATRTSSSTARSCASSALGDDPLPEDLAGARRAHLGARARGGRARVPRRRDLPRLAARGHAVRARLGASRWRARSSALIGSGLFVRFGEVFEGFLPARRLPGEFFELNATGTALVGRRGGGTYRLGDPIEVRGRVDRAARGQGRGLAGLIVRLAYNRLNLRSRARWPRS